MAKQKANGPKFSFIIANICTAFDEAKSDSEWSKSEVVRLDRLTQDYLHQLELGELTYKERAKVATKLQQCRQMRRIHKDTAEILEPLITYLETEKGKQLINLLREVLGKTRKTEERMETRVYWPREMGGGPIVGGKK